MKILQVGPQLLTNREAGGESFQGLVRFCFLLEASERKKAQGLGVL